MKHHTSETCGSVICVDINHRLLRSFQEEARHAEAMEETLVKVMQAVQDEQGNIRHRGQEGRADLPEHLLRGILIPLLQPAFAWRSPVGDS